MIQKQWISPPQIDIQKIDALAKSINMSNIIATILLQRGIDTKEKALDFFRPQISNLHSPFLMKNMELAANRLISAVNENQKILIYGDYDVDGTTSVAMMYLFLKDLNANIEFYIPDRYSEGYGLSNKGVEYAIENHFNIIITLDCGTKAINEICLATNSNIDVIVCDHHTPGEKLPDAYAVLNPKQIDCSYPFKELSGCGVGFKLIHAYCLKQNLDLKSNLFRFLDLVTISIACDIVSITDENRIIAYFGLKKIKQKPLIGVQALLEQADIVGKDLTVSDLVFKFGPRINAAGRIETGRNAVNLLIADNISDAKNICSLININNEERRAIDKSITNEALYILEQTKYEKKYSTVLYNEAWHKGVVGIVASRLTENYYRPTIVLTQANGLLTGSARSVSDFDLFKAIESCSDLLENFGGHKYAAGLSLKPENLLPFIDSFESVVKHSITEEQLVPKVQIDYYIDIDEISSDLYQMLRFFEPFGPGNMTPVFASVNVKDTGNSRPVGVDKEHLKLSVYQNNINRNIDGIAFGKGAVFEQIYKNEFDISYSITENTFRGVTNIQLDVKDIRVN